MIYTIEWDIYEVNVWKPHSLLRGTGIVLSLKVGTQLLATQKPIKRQVWWKGKFAFCLRPATGGRVGAGTEYRPLSGGQFPPTDDQWAGAFIGEGRGLHAETAQSARNWNWSCGGLTSIILIALSIANRQFQGRFVPISLRPALGMVAAYVMATVWSSCS